MLESIDILVSFTLIMLVVSLLITVAVQTVSAALNLRGHNLARGVTNILIVACPALQKDAGALVDHVLASPILSDAAIRWHWLRKISGGIFKTGLATAARPKEVFDALVRLADGDSIGMPATPAKEALLRATAQQVLEALGVPAAAAVPAGQIGNAAAATARDLDQSAQDILKSLPAEQQAAVRNAFEGYASHLQMATDHLTSRAGELVHPVETDAAYAYHKFQHWYGISQERAQAWFATHARLVTVLFAILFAGLFQLDTIEIFRLVSSNKDVRDKLVAQVSNVSAQAQQLIGSSQSAEQDALAAFAKTRPANQREALQTLPIEANATREDVRDKVAAIVGATDTSALESFDNILDQTAETRLNEGSRDFQTLKSSLDNNGFDLLPKGTGWRWGTTWDDGFRIHWFGMLCSVALLSLGAPFWFNILSSLTSLRSAVADNIEDETKTAQKTKTQKAAS